MGDTPPPRHREITPPPRHRDITPPPRHRDRYSSSPSPRERERERLPERSRSRSPVRRGKPINDGLDRSRSRTPPRREKPGSINDGRDRSRSRTPPRRSRRGEPDALNPGNNLYVTGLSTRVNEKDLLEHFSQEGKVLECRLVLDPRTRESRGFGFVTMEHLEDAERCIKYLNRSTLEGRIITVEKLLLSQTLLVSSLRPLGPPEFGSTLPPLLLSHLVSSAATVKIARTNPTLELGFMRSNGSSQGIQISVLQVLPCA
ncbi:uncharacterized protein [Physcomitrium patens]|uniref:uncharacterized protein isoform X3 n=1 Tax=Physcomitrium patens TaxID=3218 RepID=UPI003CCD8A66